MVTVLAFDMVLVIFTMKEIQINDYLYLPHYDQEYWRPWHNRKHLHVLTREVLYDFMKDHGFKNIFCSERDLNHSFAIVGEYSG